MKIYKCCMAGPYHIDNDLPCQDSYATGGRDDYTVAVVADGLGSELYSDIASDVASKKVVEYCEQNLDAGMSFEEIRKIMNNAFVYASKAVLERAVADGNDLDEYDTTVCLAVYDGERLYYGQSGDSGMIALLENGEYVRVTTQQRDEDGGVFPLFFGPEKWEFGCVEGPVSAVMLMTDGVFEQICPKLLMYSDVDVNIPLAQRFIDHFDCTDEEMPSLESAMSKYLENYPRTHLDDDKTVVVLINEERKPAVKDEEYYRSPDWETLYELAMQKLAEANADEYAVADEPMLTDAPTTAGDSDTGTEDRGDLPDVSDTPEAATEADDDTSPTSIKSGNSQASGKRPDELLKKNT